MQLRCQKLRKSFGGVAALSDIDLVFPTTGCVAIIGPNGAGKSTLLNVITGVATPESGSILLNDRNITFLRRCDIARLGIARTFQDVRLINGLSVLENIILARPRQRRERLWQAITRVDVEHEEAVNASDARRLLEFVGLADQSSTSPRNLSYGQQKLLSICACLATEARILLLDEPVAGVQQDMVVRISDCVRRVVDQERLVVVVEHDIAMVRNTADLVVVMDEGKVIACGAPAAILELPEILEAYIS